MSNEQEPITEPNNANAIGVRELRHKKGFHSPSWPNEPT